LVSLLLRPVACVDDGYLLQSGSYCGFMTHISTKYDPICYYNGSLIEHLGEVFDALHELRELPFVELARVIRIRLNGADRDSHFV